MRGEERYKKAREREGQEREKEEGRGGNGLTKKENQGVR